ncbi:CBASS cGAMP-activated phospholipase [Nitrospirillum sp. BR 11752]|uniref:CBASS cGAMP-activated phospholipase n=1 Tax=Nitrospirillum sp. BR 11752 TaxID=3104293 RepID=UPI002EAFC8DE|nr:CBASS cGAMP-activated phospholipase [Nitrospirillum sp. BR 11752]
MRQILSLSGGGYRGIFTAKILMALQEKSDLPIVDRFDLIAGTSIGGIIACGLAAGIPVSQIHSAMKKNGPAIFDSSIRLPLLGFNIPLPRKGILRTRYSADGLKSTIEAVLGDKASSKLSQIEKPLLIISVNRSLAKPVIFSTGPFLNESYSDVTLLEACLSTSAAPTYFPEQAIKGDNLVDGGIIANSPDSIALIKALSIWAPDRHELKMLSIGTAGESLNDHYRVPGKYGAIRWLLARRLYDITMRAQERLSIELTSQFLLDRHIRIDNEPSQQQRKKIGMDKTGEFATSTLESLANESLQDMPGRDRQILGEIMRHKSRI